MSDECSIRIRYFASLREARGLPVEVVSTAARKPVDLYHELCALHGFALPSKLVRFAVNGEFADPNTLLGEGDEVSLIPPVAGG